jgi:hypothetical protein
VRVVGASNQWFAQTVAALAMPRTGAGELAAKVEQQWEVVQEVVSAAEVPISRKFSPALKQFASWPDDELRAAIQQHRAALNGGEEPIDSYPDLSTPEWETFLLAGYRMSPRTSRCAGIRLGCRSGCGDATGRSSMSCPPNHGGHDGAARCGEDSLDQAQNDRVPDPAEHTVVARTVCRRGRF